MSANLKANSSQVVAGLGTYTYTVKVAGVHFVSVTSTDCPLSNLSIVVNLNGSPMFSSPALDNSRKEIGIQGGFECAVNDVITVVLSSSESFEDQLLNTLKTVIRLDGTQNA